MTGWHAVKSRATQLNIQMTDEEYKQCTAAVKAMADIRQLAVDDVDSVLRAFHRGLKLGQPVALLPDLTDAEKALLAKKENEIPRQEVA